LPTSNIQHPTSNIQHPTSNIPAAARNIQHPLTGTKSESTKMKCPRDGWVLRDGEIEGVPAHRCPRCNGVSIELRGNDQLSFDPVMLKAAAWDSAENGATEILISPKSGELMRVFHYRGVELDYCAASNSVWLDRVELEKISRAYLSKLKREMPKNHFLEGLDIALGGVDFVGFIGEAIGSLIDL